MRGWFIYSGEAGWYYCTAVLENGFAFASHICSHPHFADGA